jgi:hypothetical protein
LVGVVHLLLDLDKEQLFKQGKESVLEMGKVALSLLQLYFWKLGIESVVG